MVIYNNQDIFKAQFLNDKANGYGNYIYKNGKNKIGYWINDNLSGIGYEIDSNEIYVGEFEKGEKSGIGTFKSNDNGNILYEGELKNNNYNGYGIKYYEDGNRYFGNWLNNYKDGYGEFISIGGQKFIGYFKNDIKDGFGLYYLLKHTYHVGFWENGKLEGLVKIFIGNENNYGIWKEGKKIRAFMDENELKDKNDLNLDKYSLVLNFEIKSITHYFEEDEE